MKATTLVALGTLMTGALLAMPAAPVEAAADVCRGDDAWPKGKRGTCKRVTTYNVAATASGRDDHCRAMRSFKRGTLTLCVGMFYNPSYGGHYCGLYLKVDGEVDMQRLYPGVSYDNAPINGDDLTGEDTGMTRVRIAFVIRDHAVSQPAIDFLTEDGYLVSVRDALVSWDYGGIKGCHASARILERQR